MEKDRPLQEGNIINRYIGEIDEDHNWKITAKYLATNLSTCDGKCRGSEERIRKAPNPTVDFQLFLKINAGRRASGINYDLIKILLIK